MNEGLIPRLEIDDDLWVFGAVLHTYNTIKTGRVCTWVVLIMQTSRFCSGQHE